MVQVLPETSNSNLYLDSFRRTFANAQEGYSEGKKQALLDSIGDPNATPVQKASAQEKFIRQFGKADDLIKFQKEQGRQKAIMGIEQLLNPQPVQQQQQQQQVDPLTGQQQQPNQPINADNLMQGQQQAPQIAQQAPEVNPQALDKAILGLAQYDPQAANAVSGILDRRQKDKINAEKEGYRREEAREQSIQKSYENSQKYREKVINNDSAYDKTNMVLDRLQHISTSRDPEDITKPAFVALMQKLGVPTAAWGTQTDQEIDKLSNELTKNIPEGWKGKILQSEFHSLLRTLPNLLNSPEGMQLIVRNMKLLMEPFRLEYNIMNDLKKDYQSREEKLPYDFQDQVYERMKPQMEKLSEEFVKGTDEAINLSERIARGGTVGDQKIKKGQQQIQKQNEKLPPPKRGFIRMERDGKIFDFPEDQKQKRSDFGFKPL